MTTELPPPGWYADPHGGAGQTYWDGNQWRSDVSPAIYPAAASPAESASLPAQNGSATDPHAVNYGGQPLATYKYKNPVLYALGGLLLPPLVLFLMGGDRTTCLWILGLWGLFWVTVWIFGLGAIFVLAAYVWSAIACHQEAIKQNTANGLV